MAQLKGKGAFTAVNLLAKTYNNNVTRDGKTRYIDVMIDHRDERGRTQTNLHLASRRTKDDEGNVRYNNGAPYSAGQFDKIVETAGPNVEPILDRAGREIGRVFAVKANLMPSAKGNGLVLNSDSLAQSDFKIDDKTMDGQFATMAANRNAVQAQDQARRGNGTNVPARQATAEGEAQQAPEPAAEEEPAVG
ncbi:hypothetical protein ACFOY4_01720 [Actinomadura syzygii]|uniref:hypothetical protein n=1 Tax=Actinomadura syzygii TaxID=1427538 RepID=UPI0016520299|nr:hypothetical protein [Actinomadura syzygii]